MELFKIGNELGEDKLHPKFKLLKNHFSLAGERKVLTDWTKGFKDRDNKVIKEFQTTFHSSLWEFYLFALFKEQGFELDFSKNRPDFIIKNPYKINVEAVVSNIRDGGRPETDRNTEDILDIITSPYLQEDFNGLLNEAIVRHSQSILSKVKMFSNEYSKCKWIEADTPYVIALGSYDQVNYGREFWYSIMALLYGAYINVETDEFEEIEFITKPSSTSKIPVGLFRNSNLEDVSAIMFSCTVTLGKLSSLAISQGINNLNSVLNILQDSEFPHYKLQVVSEKNPEELSDGLFIFHNPFAKNKLPKNAFVNTNAIQFFCENDRIDMIGQKPPIFARLNMPKVIVEHTIDAIYDSVNAFNMIKLWQLEKGYLEQSTIAKVEGDDQ